MGKMKSPASLNFTWLSSGAEVIIIIIITNHGFRGHVLSVPQFQLGMTIKWSKHQTRLTMVSF